MWILHFLPDSFLEFVVNAVLLTGIVTTVITCFFLKYLVRLVPAVAPYTFTAQVISVIILLSGVYFKGGYSTEMLWRDRVEEARAKVQEAEQRAHEYSDKLDQVTRERDKLRSARGRVIIEQVERIKIDPRCEKLSDEIVDIHNQAAKMNELIEQKIREQK